MFLFPALWNSTPANSCRTECGAKFYKYTFEQQKSNVIWNSLRLVGGKTLKRGSVEIWRESHVSVSLSSRCLPRGYAKSIPSARTPLALLSACSQGMFPMVQNAVNTHTVVLNHSPAFVVIESQSPLSNCSNSRSQGKLIALRWHSQFLWYNLKGPLIKLEVKLINFFYDPTQQFFIIFVWCY